MPCRGNCFWLPALERLEAHREQDASELQQDEEQCEARQDRRQDEPEQTGRPENDQRIYSPLLPWQTRILSLQPGHDQLRADLVVVNLLNFEGVNIHGTTHTIGYRALSYVWGSTSIDQHQHTLICEGSVLTISHNLAKALQALRHPTDVVHLWADAICINQSDDAEKAQQVATMLTIYKKAESVCAWLGESDQNTPLAFSYLLDCAKKEHSLQSVDSTVSHSEKCLGRLHLIYSSLMELYERPYLKRQWIRQEIYAARQATVRCGENELPWENYIQAALHTQAMRKLLVKTHKVPLSRQSRLDPLIEEAQANSVLAVGGVKPYREFREVLSRSIHFDVTDERDIIYAVLGICGISATTDHLKAEESAIVVDYSKTIVDVYLDTSRYLVKKGQLEDFVYIVNLNKPSSLHFQGLSTWAVDWRSGLLKDTYISAETQKIWVPLSTDRADLPENHEPPVPGLDWLWPEPCSSAPEILILPARAINYIAYVSEYTCPPEDFLKSYDSNSYVLGLAGHTIHARRMPLKFTCIFRQIPSAWTRFKQDQDDWRIAVLGVGYGNQIVLVPGATKKGDLVLTALPQLIPIVIHPIQADLGTACGLFEPHDAYESVAVVSPRLAAIINVLAVVRAGVRAHVSTWALTLSMLLDLLSAVIRLTACICAILAVVSVKGELGDDDYGEDSVKEDRINTAFRVMCIAHIIVTARCLIAVCFLQTSAYDLAQFMPYVIPTIFDLIGLIPGGILLHTLHYLITEQSGIGIGSQSDPSVDVIYATLYVASLGLMICSVGFIPVLVISHLKSRSTHQQKVLGKLDNVVQTMEGDWQFRGPLITQKPEERENIWERPIQAFRLR